MKAIKLATRAVELKDKGEFIETLAAAYAEAGRFQEAIKTEERAIAKLKQEGGTKEALAEAEGHLAFYKDKAGMPSGPMTSQASGEETQGGSTGKEPAGKPVVTTSSQQTKEQKIETEVGEQGINNIYFVQIEVDPSTSEEEAEKHFEQRAAQVCKREGYQGFRILDKPKKHLFGGLTVGDLDSSVTHIKESHCPQCPIKYEGDVECLEERK